MPQTSVSLTHGVALDGMIADAEPYVERSYVSEEASAEMPFGTVVKQGTADNGCLKLTAVTDKLLGIIRRSHAFHKDVELGDTGLKPKVMIPVVVRGTMWVPCEEAMTPSSAKIYVRAIAAGAEVAGAFRDSTDASDLIDVTAFVRVLTSSTGAGRIKIAFDFTMRGATPL